MLSVDLFFCFDFVLVWTSVISRLPVWEQAHVYFNSTYKGSGERLENEIETTVRAS